MEEKEEKEEKMCFAMLRKDTPKSRYLIARIVCANKASINYDYLTALIDSCFAVNSLLWRTGVANQNRKNNFTQSTKHCKTPDSLRKHNKQIILHSTQQNNDRNQEHNSFAYFYDALAQIQSKNLTKALPMLEILAQPYKTTMDTNPPLFDKKTGQYSFNIPITMYDHAAIFAYAKVATLLEQFEKAHTALVKIAKKSQYQAYPISIAVPLLLGSLAFGPARNHSTITHLNKDPALYDNIFDLYEKIANSTFIKETKTTNICFDFAIACTSDAKYESQIIGPIIISFDEKLLNATQIRLIIPLVFDYLKMPNKMWHSKYQKALQEIERNNDLAKSVQITFKITKSQPKHSKRIPKNHRQKQKERKLPKKKSNIKYLDRAISLYRDPGKPAHRNFYERLINLCDSLPVPRLLT